MDNNNNNTNNKPNPNHKKKHFNHKNFNHKKKINNNTDKISPKPIAVETPVVEQVVLEETPQTVVGMEPQAPKATVEVVGIRFKPNGKIYYFAPSDIAFEVGDAAIVETVRGIEFGSVAIVNKMVSSTEIIGSLKPVLRKATDADIAKNQANKQVEMHAREAWEKNVLKNKLVMQLVDAEYTFDNTKLIFYFTAEGRIDFRELVKDLAGIFRTRIELRQIGVRDEAKLIGGIGICGRAFCCKSFLADFTQVSIKMAKDQNVPLSSSKISGACGRLMCCLKYEQEVYEMEYASFPRIDSIVQTPNGKGVIIESNFLSGKIKVKIDNEINNPFKYFTKDDIKIIGYIKKNDNSGTKELQELEDK